MHIHYPNTMDLQIVTVSKDNTGHAHLFIQYLKLHRLFEISI